MGNFELVVPSDSLTITLERNKSRANRTEKAISENIIAPILNEVANNNEDKISLFSGEPLEGNKEQGLNGVIDFIISNIAYSYDPKAPIIALVEAKKQDIEAGIPQCIAEMLAAKIINEREGKPKYYIYGCVTTGNDWVFLRLNETKVLIESNVLYLNDLPKLLGAFQWIINQY